MIKRIVYNRIEDGGVSVCTPTRENLAAMCNGGFWPFQPWYYPGFAEIQIERQIADGIRADTAARFARAMMEGGFTTAEAFGLIRDRDCERFGTAIELIDASELPLNRWFRNAWRRSPNGGPIYESLALARPIQFGRLRHAVEAENKRRDDAYGWRQPIEVDWHAMRRRIAAAGSIEELRTIWLPGVAQ